VLIDDDDDDLVPAGYWDALEAVISRLPKLPPEPSEPESEPLI
jgi:hypothetical protein